MKAASLSEIKKELSELRKEELFDLLVRLAKYKKENKELLDYLLFESHNEEAYIEKLKEETDLLFSGINKSNVYFAKKGLRKILRIIQKHIKFSGSKHTEVQLLLYFCIKLIESGIPVKRHKVLQNLYLRTVDKIEKSLKTLHQDLQEDYKDELGKLKIGF